MKSKKFLLILALMGIHGCSSDYDPFLKSLRQSRSDFHATEQKPLHPNDPFIAIYKTSDTTISLGNKLRFKKQF